MDKPETAALFPTPLLRVDIPPKLSTACNAFEKAEMWHDKESQREYGLHSRNTYIMDEPECAELKKFVLDIATDFAQKTLMYDYDEWIFSQTWVSWKEPGQFHTAHTHPNSVISGVFFYGHGEEKTPAIHFHKDESQGGSCQSIMLKEKRVKNGSPFSWKTFVVNFKPGMLLLFPSYFRHSVPPNQTQYTRKSVSMNIVPKGGIGDPHSLTELLFHKVL